MRNGNGIFLLTYPGRFLCSYPTYEEWKLYLQQAQLSVTRNVLILPMRNGNPGLNEIIAMSKERSYPTYEEWKLKLIVGDLRGMDCSYPTYEEWKPS